MQYFSHSLVRKGVLEKREYQEKAIENALKAESSLVVAPTAVGKTVIAVMLTANVLEKGKKVLVLAPTRPLAMQHKKSFSKALKVREKEIVLVTGMIPANKRKELYQNAEVIVSTPQCIKNDLEEGVEFEGVGLVVFDEAHRAIGDYSYVFIARKLGKVKVLALTASPGSEKKHIEEICNNLNVKNIEIIGEREIKEYMPELKIEWRRVSLNENFSAVQALLKDFIKETASDLRKAGIGLKGYEYFNRAKLLEAQRKVSKQIELRGREKPFLYSIASKIAGLIKANHALLLIETQGANAFLNYFEKLGKENSRAAKLIVLNKKIVLAKTLAEKIVEKKERHPKLIELIEIIKKEISENSRILVFNHFRDSVHIVEEELNLIEGVKAKSFIGQAKKQGRGMSQKEQANAIKEFESGELNVLVATSVAEEGLDIPACDLVVFFEPVPSEIRYIQRRGRTARMRKGKAIILITRKTKDEAFYWTARRKEKSMARELEEIKRKGIARQETLKDYW